MAKLPQYAGQPSPDDYLTKQNGLTLHERPENMSPAKIRQYLASILVQNHECDVEEAKEIASYWLYGRASDFYQYDLDTFKDMFGDEVGMLFYLYSRGLTPGGRITEGGFWYLLTYVYAFLVYLFVMAWIINIGK
ncbi:hypothetical protein BOTCAL_0706g00010 [Botryotinia calthae]|uniref:Uncharacterized protein n=1 Tax=Botryotinia calthae TaxID=38488 RepID=A0A4Y8CHG5_9HELO|nr:hypothetical protein BOTCAL_0706g00010 [Botryotinia calthae]